MPRRNAARLARTIVSCLALVAAGTLIAPCAASAADHGRSKRQIKNDLRFAAEMAEKGLWREALFRWRRVLASRPEDAALHNNVGVALEALGKQAEALAVYEHALELAGEDRDAEFEANYLLARRAAKLAAPAKAGQEQPDRADRGNDDHAPHEHAEIGRDDAE